MISYRRFSRLLCLSAVFALLWPGLLAAQELKVQPTPFSTFLDFSALFSREKTRGSLPIWLESVSRFPTQNVQGQTTATTVRLRFRQFGSLNDDLLLRVFYDDVRGLAPTITACAVDGSVLFLHGPFGAALELPNSETVTVPMTGVHDIDIETPGFGTNVRGVFVATLKKSESRHALDFAPDSELSDPFKNTPAAPPTLDDLALYGRVRATVDPGIMKLAPLESPAGTWEFDLGMVPLVVIVTFDILNVDALAAPEILVNEHPVGPASIQLPDLADPGYQPVVRAMDPETRFRYAGWLRCQRAIPASLLVEGLNKITVQLSKESGPVAVRSVELQLKNDWR